MRFTDLIVGLAAINIASNAVPFVLAVVFR